MTVELGVLIAVIGCLVGVAGWLLNRDKRIASDAEWRGTLNEKLDNIRAGVTGLRSDVDRIDHAVSQHGERLSKVEASASQAHKRLDEHLKKG